MSHGQRHTACKLCREKKVRCDGEQPACSKCLRSGELCVYVPVPVPTRATLANMVQDLRDRLERAETQMHSIQVPSGQPHQRNYSAQSCLTDFDPRPYSRNTSLYEPFAPAWTGPPPPPCPSADLSGSVYGTSGLIMLNDAQQHTSNFEMEQSTMDQQLHHASQASSLRPIRDEPFSDLSNSAQSTSSKSSASSSNAGPHPALDAVKELVLGVSATQEEMSCSINAVAEHLAWAITLPGTDRRSAEVLKVLIVRLKEIRQASDAGMCLSYRQLCSSLEMVTGWGEQVADLKTQMQADKARTRKFFESEFNIYLPLPAQRDAKSPD